MSVFINSLMRFMCGIFFKLFSPVYPYIGWVLWSVLSWFFLFISPFICLDVGVLINNVGISYPYTKVITILVSIYPFLHLSICFHIYLYIHIYLSCLSIHISINSCKSIYLIYLYIYLVLPWANWWECRAIDDIEC